MNIETLLHFFFETRNQTHLWHFQTTSFAEHEALGSFYPAWIDLTDKFIETYAGKYARPEGGMRCDALPYQEGLPYQYMVRAAAYLASEEIRSIATDTDLQNILDELQGLARQAAYQLTLK